MRSFFWLGWLLAGLQAPAGVNHEGVSMASQQAGLASWSRELCSTIEQRIALFDTELRLLDAIPRLDNRGGCFADLDGDGDLDFVATEMIHGTEEVRIHLAGARGWRRGDRRSKGLDGKHPLQPWILADDGSGAPAVVLPTGWPPYLYLLPTDGDGRFSTEALELGSYLPERVSKPLGVDNCPYEILECIPATETEPAKILGLIDDRFGPRAVELQFTIVLSRANKQLLPSLSTEPVESSLPLADIPTDFEVIRPPRTCEHESDERRAIIANRLRDVTGDHIPDLVTFSGILSAHVAPGFVDDGGRLGFEAYDPVARDLPIEDVRFWFPRKLRPKSLTTPHAIEAVAEFRRLGVRFEERDEFDADFVLLTERRKGWLLSYYYVEGRYIPVQDYRSFWRSPDPKTNFSDRYREMLLLDADRDGSADVLSVHVGKEYMWLKPPPSYGQMLDHNHIRELDGGRLRCGLVFGLGDRNDRENRTLALFPDRVEVPEDLNDGVPIGISRVPVFRGGSKPEEQRILVHYRPGQLGLVFDLRSDTTGAELRKRHAEAWQRRAEQRVFMRQYHRACDRHLCAGSGSQHLEIFEDAAALASRALPFLDSPYERGLLQRRIAGYEAMAGRLKAALHRYRLFVEWTARVDPLDRPPSRLAGLFEDELFRLAHRGWRAEHELLPEADRERDPR